MLPGLQQGQEKMSKSDPSSSIFMDDEEGVVNDKIKKAYCPPKIVQGNPCLEYIKFIIFPWFNDFKVERSAANGGDKTYTSHEELIADYAEEKLHPADLKPALSKALNKILQGIMKTLSVNKMTSAGCKVKILVADWFAQLNNKMGGDLKKIENVGHYLIEIWKAAGMDLNGVEFLWSSKEINSRASEYWSLVIKIALRTNLHRIMRCVQIMGRNNQDLLTSASILYPCMQCADIFFLKADICQLGMDQRKVNVLAREYCKDIKRKNKPIILSHHMLPGLQQGQEKMSKSDPSSSIFMEDKEDDVTNKINEAYCPPKIVQGNPCLEYINFIIFPWFNEFKVQRSAANGGDKTYTSHEELIADYAEEKLHPADLKPALSKALNKILQVIAFSCLCEFVREQLLDISQ
ncbi:hypothetical protein LWI29_007960 [Acer saccharum]|uniref:tyrosine--tRNA ligase n=1 Tax=Acer saccharum TaxID=4024 RepID=A0AA39S149_ACESA|nr:hypothetical protein LWI29_007960 [Acer saccharum]